MPVEHAPLSKASHRDWEALKIFTTIIILNESRTDYILSGLFHTYGEVLVKVYKNYHMMEVVQIITNHSDHGVWNVRVNRRI